PSPFDANRWLGKPPMPPELEAEATCTDERAAGAAGAGAGLESVEARLKKLPFVVSAGSAGGLTCGGIVPEAVRIVAPGPPWNLTALRKVGFMPPSTLILAGAAGVPRLVTAAGCLSPRACLLRTAAG